MYKKTLKKQTRKRAETKDTAKTGTCRRQNGKCGTVVCQPKNLKFTSNIEYAPAASITFVSLFLFLHFYIFSYVLKLAILRVHGFSAAIVATAPWL